MYLPRLFRVDDEPTLLDLARANPFATVIAGAEIAHLPCLLDREDDLVLRITRGLLGWPAARHAFEPRDLIHLVGSGDGVLKSGFERDTSSAIRRAVRE